MGIGVIEFLIPMYGRGVFWILFSFAMAWLIGFGIAYMRHSHQCYLAWTSKTVLGWAKKTKWSIVLFFLGCIVAAFI